MTYYHLVNYYSLQLIESLCSVNITPCSG